ncbi:failed axon connections homolog [Montipora foliosa]|uniref:failed axon connections homolog n=1 Tax=Montipora foliosa TaxID=591990 RepID=UPI0035F14235
MHVAACIGISMIAAVIIYLTARKYRKKPRRKLVEPGVVVLHQFRRSPWLGVLSFSPPCLKLETFLRMVKIPYENDFRLAYSKQGKMPWIEFNGKEIADSDFCTRFLSKEFHADLDSHLSATERAIAHSIRTMLESNTYWTMVHARWVDIYGAEVREMLFGRFFLPMKYVVRFMAQRKIKNYLWSHGIGRHTPQEMYGIAERDLLALSEILGKKDFLFGDKPCLADAALFSFIVACNWAMPDCPMAILVKTKAQNLEEHAHRMKELYYPDWDELLSTKLKTK